MCILAACGAGASAEVSAPQELALSKTIEMFYFFDEICTSCIDDELFFQLFREEASDVADMYPYRLIPVNVARASGRQVFADRMAEFGHPIENITFPVMMVNSHLYQGYESIRQNIREAFLVAGEDIFID